jgi:hypothetical protein
MSSAVTGAPVSATADARSVVEPEVAATSTRRVIE